jgi:hypothetical protein
MYVTSISKQQEAEFEKFFEFRHRLFKERKGEQYLQIKILVTCIRNIEESCKFFYMK